MVTHKCSICGVEHNEENEAQYEEACFCKECRALTEDQQRYKHFLIATTKTKDGSPAKVPETQLKNFELVISDLRKAEQYLTPTQVIAVLVHDMSATISHLSDTVDMLTKVVVNQGGLAIIQSLLGIEKEDEEDGLAPKLDS